MVVGVTISPPWPHGAKTALGQRPSQAGSPFSPLRALRPKTALGRLVSMGRPIGNKKKCFLFFFYYLGREILWKMFVYSFWLQKL
jgi:hypothetical protein